MPDIYDYSPYPGHMYTQGVPEETTPHFTEAKEGLAFVGGEVRDLGGRGAGQAEGVDMRGYVCPQQSLLLWYHWVS
jgi:hypothetical protein